MTSHEVLYIETQKTIEEAIQLFFVDFGISPNIKRHDYGSKVYFGTKGPGFSIDGKVFPAHMPQTNYIKADLGFTPTIHLMLVYDKSSDYQTNKTQFIQGTLSLVKQTNESLALYFEYNGIILIRKKGRELLIKSDDEIWTPERLALLTIPYKVSTHLPRL